MVKWQKQFKLLIVIIIIISLAPCHSKNDVQRVFHFL